MTSWKLFPQERDPDEGSFTAIHDLVITQAALALFTDEELKRAVEVLVESAFAKRLKHVQVIEREDGECLCAADDNGVITLCLPSDLVNDDMSERGET